MHKGTDRAKAGTIVQDRPTRPFVDALWGPHHPLTEGDHSPRFASSGSQLQTRVRNNTQQYYPPQIKTSTSGKAY